MDFLVVIMERLSHGSHYRSRGKEQTMSRHICAECKHQYFMLYKRHLKCMNEQSEKYGEDIEPGDYCEEWEERRENE